jgi:hypothetical protein
MQYFSTLPKVIKTDGSGNSILLTNLMARSSVIPSILKNVSLYYQYDIQEGDTPESIAYKYYGESYRYWIVLFANEIIDPLWQWPMKSNVFNSYMNSKYPSIDVYNTVKNYQKIVTSLDVNTNITTVDTITIDEETFNSLITKSANYSLPTGQVNVSITKHAQSIFEYELDLNESNRTINLLNNNYVSEIEREFKSLMNT